MAKQNITLGAWATNTIQSFSNQVVGQATSLKSAFDKASLDIITYINNTLIAELNGNAGSVKIGHSSNNINADNVGDALEEIKQDLVGITQGAVADGSVTDVKLSNGGGQIKERVSTLESTVINLAQARGTGTIPTTGWVANVGDNTLKLDYALAGVSPTSWVSIALDKDFHDTALDAELNPTVVEYSGGITFYANTAPSVGIPFKYKVVK